MRYRFLKPDDLPAVHATFAKAFADYFVEFTLSADQFQNHLSDNGVRLELSVGAFDGAEMVGLLLNGVDSWQGQLAAYDAGTGVIPSHRGRGIAGQMLRYAIPTLRAKGVGQCLLEVIRENEAAIRAYRKLGFTETRALECVSLPANRVLPQAAHSSLRIRPIAQPDWTYLQTFWDWQPAWQNSVASIGRMRRQKMVLGAFDGHACLGYGVILPESGRISQLAVAKSQRGQGIATQLLHAFREQAGPGSSLSMINIEGTASDTLAFFAARGFERTISQFEMALDVVRSA